MTIIWTQNSLTNHCFSSTFSSSTYLQLSAKILCFLVSIVFLNVSLCFQFWHSDKLKVMEQKICEKILNNLSTKLNYIYIAIFLLFFLVNIIYLVYSFYFFLFLTWPKILFPTEHIKNRYRQTQQVKPDSITLSTEKNGALFREFNRRTIHSKQLIEVPDSLTGKKSNKYNFYTMPIVPSLPPFHPPFIHSFLPFLPPSFPPFIHSFIHSSPSLPPSLPLISSYHYHFLLTMTTTEA